MTAPRGLTAEEAQAWEKVAATVKPLDPPRTGEGDHARHGGGARQVEQPANAPVVAPKAVNAAKAAVKPQAVRQAHRPPPPPAPRNPANNLDGQWDKRLKSGAVQPDFTLDLHGHNLDAAYDRLMSGVEQARAMGARTILLITGKPRAADPADRGSKRGAIRAKVLDWLAASGHNADIAAVRRAHIRHGGEGALYIVLRRQRG